MRSMKGSHTFKRRFLYPVVLGIVLYVGVYVPDSLFGGYWGHPVGGTLEYSFGMSIPTVFLWQPYWGYADNAGSSWMGWFFHPLISLDRSYFHQSKDLSNQQDETDLRNSRVQWHPEAIKEANRRMAEEAEWRRHCTEDPRFCLESAAQFHTESERHFLAALLIDKYKSNTLNELGALSERHDLEMNRRAISRVMEEVKKLESESGR